MLAELAEFIAAGPRPFDAVFADRAFFNDFLAELFRGAFVEYSPRKEALAEFLLAAFSAKGACVSLPKTDLFGIVFASLESQRAAGPVSGASLELLASLVKAADEDFEQLSVGLEALFAQFLGPLLGPRRFDP